MRLGIFGGTFDPVHLGHLVLAERSREQLALERVLWVPAADPWRKGGQEITPSWDRVAMVQLAIMGQPAFELSTAEVDRQGPSYSVDTVRHMRDAYPGAELVVLLGMDALLDLPNWREPQPLVEMVKLAVAPRGGRRLSRQAMESILPGLAGRVVWVEMPRMDISATKLRRWVAEGRSIRYLVPKAVEEYINERGLYRNE